MSRARRVIAVSVPLGLYLVSLILPATGSFVVGSDTRYSGFEAFEVGFRATFLLEQGWPIERIEMAAAWLANPAIWLAIASLALAQRRIVTIAAGVGCVLCLSVLPRWGEELVRYPAYWCWWGSSVAALVSGLFLLARRPQPYVEDFRPMNSPPLTPDP
jgi:hypothetical protein